MSETEQEQRGELGWAAVRGRTYAAMRQPDGDVWVRVDSGWTRARAGKKVAESFKPDRN